MLRFWGPIAVVAGSLLFGVAGGASADPCHRDGYYGRSAEYQVSPVSRYDRNDWRYRDDRRYRRDWDDRDYRYDRDDRRARAYEDREWREERARRFREEDRDRRWRANERRERAHGRWRDRDDYR